MRSWILLLALTAACLAVPVLLYLRRFERGEQYSPLSSYRADAYGAKAFYLVAERLGYAVNRNTIAPHFAMPAGGSMLILAPGIQMASAPGSWFQEDDAGSWMSDRERDALLRWASDGGSLWIVSPYSTPLHDSLDVKIRYGPGVFEAGELVDLFGWIRDARKSLMSKIDDPDEENPSLFERYFDGLTLPTREADVPFPIGSADVARVRVFQHVRLAGPDGAMPLAVVDESPVALRVKHGKGQVVFIADLYMTSNAGIDKADNVAFLAALLRHFHPEGGPVVFDEYYHGLVNDQGIMGLLQKYSLHYFILQGGLLMLVLLWRFYPRDADPETETIERVVNTRSYLESAAALYARVLPRRTVADRLFRDWWQRETRRAHLPETAPVADLLALLDEQDPGRAAHVRDVLRQQAALSAGKKLDRQKLLRFVSELT